MTHFDWFVFPEVMPRVDAAPTERLVDQLINHIYEQSLRLPQRGRENVRLNPVFWFLSQVAVMPETIARPEVDLIELAAHHPGESPADLKPASQRTVILTDGQISAPRR
jgi:hypothetical protein